MGRLASIAFKILARNRMAYHETQSAAKCLGLRTGGSGRVTGFWSSKPSRQTPTRPAVNRPYCAQCLVTSLLYHREVQSAGERFEHSDLKLKIFDGV